METKNTANERTQATAAARDVMDTTGFPPPDAVAVRHQAPIIDLAQITKDMDQRVALVDRIHTIIQKSINPDTDIKRIGDKYRRTINFARKCFRVLGGTIKWQTYPNGLKYLRQSHRDEGGDWFSIDVSATYSTPWGEDVEVFKHITSRDAFLGEQNDDDGPEDVNEQNLVEKAVTEAFKSVVFTALGLPKDISPDELTKFGVNGARAGGHTFDGAKGAQGGNKAETQESYDKRKDMERMCRELMDAGYEKNGETASTPDGVLLLITKSDSWAGWRTCKGVSEKALPRTHHDVQAVWTKWCGDKPAGEGNQEPGAQE